MMLQRSTGAVGDEGVAMRRLALITAGLALVMSVGFTGAASAATMEGYVQPGSVWTYGSPTYPCIEVITFGAGTFTGDVGDSGTYVLRAGGKKLMMHFISGEALKTKYNVSTGDYTTGRHARFPSSLSPGARAGC